MENLPLPTNLTIEKGKEENSAIVSIWPFFPGYGTTIGNALRRVLLSSLPGAAVISYKAKNVDHEFSTLANVKEDLVEISLNLKQLRFKLYTEELQTCTLKVKGAKQVKASDIKCPTQAEVINKDLHIATLTTKDAELEMEIRVQSGRGYLSTENREKGDVEVGQIDIDSIFSPLKNVGFKLENVRVGQMTNYEKLVFNIQTDGTITPDDAINQATQILMDQFNFVLDNTKGEKKAKKTTKKSESEKKAKEEKSVKGGSASDAKED